LLEAIDAFSEELDRCRVLVEQGDWAGLYQWMEEANRLHEIL